jgi:hypothetical protein
MIVPMTLRLCLLVVGASALLHQAALGCRHYRPSFGETPERASAASSAEHSLALVQAATCTQDDRRPTPRALE